MCFVVEVFSLWVPRHAFAVGSTADLLANEQKSKRAQHVGVKAADVVMEERLQ